MFNFSAPRISILAVLASGWVGAMQAQTVTFVDGVTTPAEVLFQHPNAPLLIVRSTAQRTVQSLPLEEIKQYQLNGKTIQVSAGRPLSEDEKQRRERNRLWADEATDAQIGKYAAETWERKPLIVWAKPGESGDGLAFENWLDETGKPLVEDPWKREQPVDKHGRTQPETGVFDGDILVPMGTTRYKVLQAGNRDLLGAFAMRHLTVEANVEYEVRYTVRGNLWVKDKGSLGWNTQTGGLGSGESDKHTFLRFCNWFDIKSEPKWAYASCISHWVRINTGKNGSLEVVGISRGPTDRVSLDKGTLIISKDSYLGCGNRASFFTRPGTTLILLDGARIACHEALLGGSAGKLVGTYGIGGTIMFGTKEKPLTRDLDFSACLYPQSKIDPKGAPSDRTSGASWVFGSESHAIIHSSNPAKARVIFAPRSRDLPLTVGPKQYLKSAGRTPLAPEAELWTHPEVPTGVVAAFHGKTDFDGVVFDGFYERGIIANSSDASRWRNVTFGDKNQAPPNKLLAPR